MPIDLVDALREVAGQSNVVASDEAKAVYGTDWTRFFAPDPAAVVFARDPGQLVALVRFAGEHNIPLVPSGGRTGLSGGAVAKNKEVVVSFDKMNRILAFDETEATVTVEPGVVTRSLQQFAESKGLCYPVDFASSGSSQIGGNIATNAGGIKVLRYGLTRDQVTGLKVVTGRGDLLDLNRGLVKNATGYDLRHLFIGSEGTLGFIVEATIKLVAAPNDTTVVLLSVPEMSRIISILEAFRKRVTPVAFEFLSHGALKHVMERHALPQPFAEPGDYYVLIEFERRSELDMQHAMEAFERCVESGMATDGVVSQNARQRLDLWKYREYISESISSFVPYKNDISVRISRVPAFLEAVEQTVTGRYPEFEIVWFGHIGDGNLHLNVLKPETWDTAAFKQECERVSEEVMGIVARFEGSISAEHGVGLLKREQLKFSRSDAEIEMMRAIKQVFDPHGIMNPGKLL